MPLPPSDTRTKGRRLLALPLATALLASPLLPTSAALAVTLDGSTTTAVADADTLDLTMDGQAVVTSREQTRIGPGVVLTEFERLEPRGWQQGAVLDIDLSDEAVSLDYLYTGEITDTATVSELADQAGNIAGAINGDFFDINASGAPSGIAVDEEEGVLKTPSWDPVDALVIDQDNVAHITQTFTEGAVIAEDFRLVVEGVNPLSIPGAGVAVYTPQWGDYQRLPDNADGAEGIEVWIDGDSTVLKSQPVSDEPLPPGVRAVAARPGTEAAEQLASLSTGDSLQVTYALRSDAGADPVVGIGGGARLVENGTPIVSRDPYVHPRTAVGIDQSGTRLLLAVIDGRSADSRGMTLTELGQFMAQIGSHTAINFDGGGSTTMVVREPGEDGTSLVNSPADGSERADANGLGVVVEPGSGELVSFDVETADASAAATRVFPGLARRLVAEGLDENLTAVEAEVGQWTSSDPSIATVDADGVVTGVSSGEFSVQAATGEASGTLGLEVLGELARVQPSEAVIGLPSAGDVLPLRLTGFDARGFGAPIDVRDVSVEIGEGFTAEPIDAGTLGISSTMESGSTVVTLTVGGSSVQVPITVGTETVPITDLSDAADWSFGQARAAGSITVTTDPEGDPALRLQHDFARSTGTRGSYAIAPDGGYRIQGQPIAVTLQMKGDGSGAWPRLQMRDGDGVTVQVDATEPEYVDFEGWQQVTFTIPAGTAYPLTLQRVRIMEQAATEQYQGDITFSDLTAVVAPDVEFPDRVVYADPAVDPAGDPDDEPLRIAVVSDAQFVAENPDSAQVQAAREVLREVLAEDPDRILILGDWVDEGEVEDITLARQILDEELGGTGVPWTYVPGNHEIMGAPDMGPWLDEFGDPYTVADVDGTRIITLNSAPYTISHDPEQVRFLREQLDGAIADPAITGVVLAMHHPTQDNITGASALTDPQDAALVEDWMAEVYDAGKSTVVLSAGTGAFDVYQVDGVVHVTNGNAGKSPKSTPDRGGFSGWTMIGIDPAGGMWREADTEWLDVEVNPFVDELTVTGPSAFGPGEVIDLEGTVDENGRLVPTAWPVSHRWEGGELVHAGVPQDAPESAVAALDTGTGTLAALDRVVVDGQVVTTHRKHFPTGETESVPVEVTLTVNDVTTTHTVTVEVPVATVGNGHAYGRQSGEGHPGQSSGLNAAPGRHRG